MDIKEVKDNAREKMKGFCNVCKICDGIFCSGKVPGMGGTGTGESFKISYLKLKNIKVVMRTLHNVTEPKMNIELFGQKLSFPCLGAPITGTKFNMGGGVTEEEYCRDVIKGAVDAGTIGMIGDTGDPTCYEFGLKAIKENNGMGIAIIKPRSNEEIIKRIRMAEEAGAIAVGVDVDGAGLVTMKLFGQPVGPKSFEDLKELVNSTNLPFIVKGILSVDEAKLCAEAGVNTIVVSNHGGRVLDQCPATAEVLADIVDAVGDSMKIFVDGGIRSGVDIFKALALGADGVLICRTFVTALYGGEEEGIKTYIDKLASELEDTMSMCGAYSLNDISRDMIRK